MGKITRQELSSGVISELDKTGDLSSLTTTDKSSLVSAINEVDGKEIPEPPVTSVASKTGDVTLTKSDVGLDNAYFYGVTAGDYPILLQREYSKGLVYSIDTSGSGADGWTPASQTRFQILVEGTYRVRWGFRPSADFRNFEARIYRNDIAYGTLREAIATTDVTYYTEDLFFSQHDVVDIRIICTSGAYTNTVHIDDLTFSVSEPHQQAYVMAIGLSV